MGIDIENNRLKSRLTEIDSRKLKDLDVMQSLAARKRAASKEHREIEQKELERQNTVSCNSVSNNYLLIDRPC